MKKTLIIDDFFEDPYRVIEFAKEQEYFPRNDEQYFEGIRSPDLRDIDNEFYNYAVSKIIYSYFDKDKNYDVQGNLNFHRLGEKDYNDPHWINDKVHRDATITSTVIYLTPDAPMESGTQVYREVNDDYKPDIVCHNKFNRMITYPGPVPHSAMDLSGGKEDRLTLLFFLYDLNIVN